MASKSKNEKNTKEFSKTLLIQESILIWILTLAFILLAFYCVHCGYVGSLPWLSAMIGLPWTAYGVSQGFYYNKSKSENTQGGIKYATVMSQMQYDQNQSLGIDWSIPSSNEDFSGLGNIANNTINNKIDPYYGI